MPNKIRFILGFHSHQPVGNFDAVFEEGYQKAYKPFLEVLSRHPKIRVTLHYTGILYQWLIEHHDSFNKQLKEMVENKQIEIMTGGFYEPILSVIPDRDKIGQINKLSSFIKNNTGYAARGFWLAERVWEPQLASYLVDAGIRYTVTDDSHFRSAGLQEEDTWGYYLTEDSGKTLAIFPISERMRYLVPFEKPEKTIEFLTAVAQKGNNPVVVMADDGEKFGIWPGTHKHCYIDGWLDKFFNILEDNLHWIELTTFTDCLDKVKPLGRIYLPTASYAEMMEWAMPASTILKYEEFLHKLQENSLFGINKSFVRGGFWRNFLVKYPESNNIHKKMIYVSDKIHQITNGQSRKKINDIITEQALDKLYAGQTNCGYWHGVFGGIYLNYLRFALYRNLIEAEGLIDRIRHKNKPYLESNIFDFDSDGEPEILINTDKLNLNFKPSYGGALFELDIKEKSINLLDTLSRKQEAYHEKLKHGNIIIGTIPADAEGSKSIHDLVVAKEPNLDKYLNYDWHQRYSLLDHILPVSTTLELFSNIQYNELGDFINQPYEYDIKLKRGKAFILLHRIGHLFADGQSYPLEITKLIKIAKSKEFYQVDYRIMNHSDKNLDFLFGVEFNYALLAGYADDRYYYIPGIELKDNKLASIGESNHITEIGLKDHWLKMDCHLEWSKTACLWRFPIETISQSEAGFEKVYQSSVVFPHWHLQLSPGQSWAVQFIQNFKHF